MNTALAESTTQPITVVPPPRTVLRIERWPDHVTAELGHDLRSPYVERFWLGILGPSALWLARSLAYGLDEARSFNLDLLEVARTLGLGDRVGRHSPVQRAVERLCHFELAYLRGGVTLVVRQHVAWLDDHRVHRLSETLRAEHRLWAEADLASTPERAIRRRFASVAHLCARNRGTPDDIGRVLAGHGVPPTVAAELTCWAIEQTQHHHPITAQPDRLSA